MNKLIIPFIIMLILCSCISVEEEVSDQNEENYLFTLEILVEDAMNETGQYAYLEADKTIFDNLEDKHLIEFVKEYVEESNYNWVLIKFNDATGVMCSATQAEILTYGEINSNNSISEIIGYYSIKDDKIIYEDKK